MSKVTSLDHHRAQKKATKAAKDFVNASLKKKTPTLKTEALEQILAYSENILLQHRDSYTNESSMSHSSPEKIINAAKSQLYTTEAIPQIKGLKLCFGGEYTYAVSLNADLSDLTDKLFIELCQDLSNERKINLVLNQEIGKAFTIDDNSEKIPWTPEPLKTDALKEIVQHSKKAEVGLYNASTQSAYFSPVPLKDVLTLASTSTLSSISPSAMYDHLNIEINNDANTLVSITLNDDICNNRSFTTLLDKLTSENLDNLKYMRENNPNTIAFEQMASSLTFDENDDEMKAYMDNVLGRNKKIEPKETNDNVRSIKPR